MKAYETLAGAGIIAIILYVMVMVFLVIGWISNLFGVILPPYPAEFTTEFVIRVIGIPIFPIGGILGWL